MALSSLRHLTKYVSYEAFNLLFLHNLAFQFPHLHETIIPAGTDLGVMYPPNPYDHHCLVAHALECGGHAQGPKATGPLDD